MEADFVGHHSRMIFAIVASFSNQQLQLFMGNEEVDGKYNGNDDDDDEDDPSKLVVEGMVDTINDSGSLDAGIPSLSGFFFRADAVKFFPAPKLELKNEGQHPDFCGGSFEDFSSTPSSFILRADVAVFLQH